MNIDIAQQKIVAVLSDGTEVWKENDSHFYRDQNGQPVEVTFSEEGKPSFKKINVTCIPFTPKKISGCE